MLPRMCRVAQVLAWTCVAAVSTGICRAQANDSAAWRGNFAINPGFEEDWVNANAEGHVLSFKGDWFYNQQDLRPDYWLLTGNWTWTSEGAKSGQHALRLADGATAEQSYPGMTYQEGGGAWGVNSPKPMTIAEPARVARSWRASVWVRGRGSIRLGDATATSSGSDAWKLLEVTLPANKAIPTQAMTVTLTGPGDFDDLSVEEQSPREPNRAPNASFEEADEKGQPAYFSNQRKYRSLGPTYYVWTDWNHFFRANRGAVVPDRLIRHDGAQSLRFDVYPGDEKYVESDAIALDQAQPAPIEVAAYVRADRIKLIDIRCVNEDGADLRSHYPLQPEYYTGGTATWGNGTFEWRYVRKFFAPPDGKPLRSIRVRLCARGFNAHTLDDSGTRSYACQTGTLWWDQLYVGQPGSLAAGTVQAPAEPATSGAAAFAALGAKTAAGEIDDVRLDLGERLFGTNKLSVDLHNRGRAGRFKLKLSTSLPKRPNAVTESPETVIAFGDRGRMEVPYEIDQLAGDLRSQGKLHVEILRDNQVLADSTYAFNTWPVRLDFDVSRHYSLPAESPLTVAVNFGVTAVTLAKVRTLETMLVKATGSPEVIKQLSPIENLPEALRHVRESLPENKTQSTEFNLPTPSWWTDRARLLIFKVDLSALKVWPHDEPVRDTMILIRGRGEGGATLFEEYSPAFCRMEAPPPLPPIESVSVRDDGAILINGQPRFLTGGTHQNTRMRHTPEVIAQLNLMGMRLVSDQSAEFTALNELWTKHRLYVHQAKPISGLGSTTPVVEMTAEQQKALADFVARGGMQNVVAINTGGWEAHIGESEAERAKHQATNDWVYATAKRPVAWSHSGAANAWNAPLFPYYDINFAENEMWGPLEYNVIWTPYMKRLFKRPSTWVYLPQLYDNHPFERYRFETYENIIRGSAGVLFIQGIGDPTFNRGLAGELRHLEGPLYSHEPAPTVVIEPAISNKVTREKGKTYIVATNCGPIQIGRWNWRRSTKFSGEASHDGDTVNRMWFRPHGIRIHGFRAMPMPELIQAGDKIVQYVRFDPDDPPDWAMVSVRGDGKFVYSGVVGDFDFARFRDQLGNIVMYSELNHAVAHEINWVMEEPTHQLAIKLIGQEAADGMKKAYDAAKAKIDSEMYRAEDFKQLGQKPPAGQWHRMELDAGELGLVGKLVDGFAYLSQNGQALWDYSALERGGKVVRIFSEDTVGIDRSLLARVRFSVPGLADGTMVKALFEDRTIETKGGEFYDDFSGTETYGEEAGGIEGDMMGYVKDPNRELPRMMPSGYGYKYGPTAVHIYEIEHATEGR